MSKRQPDFVNSSTKERDEHKEIPINEQSNQSGVISRRKLLATSMAGVAVATSAMIPGVGGQVLANPNREADYNVYRYADNFPKRTIGERLREYVSVKDFGAVGDGHTNDTLAIQTAIEHVSNIGGGSVYVPRGVYLVESSTVWQCSNLTLMGEGELVTLTGGVDFITIIGDRNTIDGLCFREHLYTPENRFLFVEGDGNRIVNCTIHRLDKYVSDEVRWNEKLVEIVGNHNAIENCECYNGMIGINVANQFNKVMGCYVHDNVTGVRLSSTCRNIELAHNRIVDNDVSARSGADGILGVRNVSRVFIHHNDIIRSGEHGIYFQGDSSVIAENNVSFNYRSGIKLASYTTGLHWYDDEEEDPNYIGKDNLITNNICMNNTMAEGSDNNAGIYLQSPLRSIIVKGNVCKNQGHGIRSVFVNEDHELSDLLITENNCHGNSKIDLQANCSHGLQISNNHVKGEIATYGATTSLFNMEPLIINNTVGNLAVSRSYRPIIQNNKIGNLVINPGNNRAAELKNNQIHSQERELSLNRIAIFDGNTLNIVGNYQIVTSNATIQSFSNNVIIANDLTSSYVFNPAWRNENNGLQMMNNRFELPDGVRGIKLWGTGMLISHNRFTSGSDANIDLHEVTRCIVLGNSDDKSSGRIWIREQSSNNRIIGNGMRTRDDGLNNIVNYNN